MGIWRLTGGALCVAGLAAALAAVSYYTWLARARGLGLTAVFRDAAFTRAWSIGMCLAAIGWGLLQSAPRWERWLAFTVAASFLWDLIARARRHRAARPNVGAP